MLPVRLPLAPVHPHEHERRDARVNDGVNPLSQHARTAAEASRHEFGDGDPGIGRDRRVDRFRRLGHGQIELHLTTDRGRG